VLEVLIRSRAIHTSLTYLLMAAAHCLGISNYRVEGIQGLIRRIWLTIRRL